MEVLVRLQDIAFYRQHGYWLSPRIFRALEVLRDHLERAVNGEYETKRPLLVHTPTPGDLSEVVQVLNAHWADGHHSGGQRWISGWGHSGQAGGDRRHPTLSRPVDLQATGPERGQPYRLAPGPGLLDLHRRQANVGSLDGAGRC